MKIYLRSTPNKGIVQSIFFTIGMFFFINLNAQLDTCKVPWIPPVFSVIETHWDVPESFWQNGGHIPENVINEDTSDYARAHIKATGSATLKVTDEDSVYASGGFVGYYVKSRAFRDTIFDGVTITTYLDGVMQESYSGVHLWVEYIPQFVNDPICLGFWTTLPWNEIEITLDTAGGRVHYDVFYAVLQSICTEELPPGLPITWLSFEVQKKGEASNLKWVTAQEFNNAGYHVERSSDGRLFETIGFVDPKPEFWDIYEYSFVDHAPFRDLNYYRIRQVDRDGQIHYSAIRKLSFADEVEISSWPNPAVETIYIEMSGDHISAGEIRLINAAGVVVKSKSFDKKSDRQNSLDLRNVEPGLYNMVIESPTNRHIRKIVVLK